MHAHFGLLLCVRKSEGSPRVFCEVKQIGRQLGDAGSSHTRRLQCCLLSFAQTFEASTLRSPGHYFLVLVYHYHESCMLQLNFFFAFARCMRVDCCRTERVFRCPSKVVGHFRQEFRYLLERLGPRRGDRRVRNGSLSQK